jgi:hypothetical protein
MSMPALWVDELFARLSVRYGAAFMRQYADLDAAAVKADWGRVMSGVSADGVTYGLENLPIEKPLNAMQFRALCGSAPRTDERLKLAAPVAKPSPEVLAKVSRIGATAFQSDPLAWARSLQRREQQGERLTRAQRDAWRAALPETTGAES